MCIENLPAVQSHKLTGTRPTRNSRRRGQSLILAIIVMFILFFIGAVFVSLIANNLSNAARSKDTVSALELAKSGVQYADYFLQHSPEGADWRPAPLDPTTINPNDPDKRWLDLGYSRIDLTQGRALIRVSYGAAIVSDPTDISGLTKILDPNGKFIKIEAVGRVGFINQNDPTTFTNSPAPRLRRELVAYKAIGITDYLRFVTNKDNDSKSVAALGVPPIGVTTAPGSNASPLGMQLGDLIVRSPTPRPGNPADPVNAILQPGAPIRTNCDILPIGTTEFSVRRRNGEGVYVAGSVLLNDSRAGNLTVVDADTGTSVAMVDSSNTAYNSNHGDMRYDGANPDSKGYAQGISRLEPPRIDDPDPSTGVTRYRTLTRDSGRFLGAGAAAFNTGRYGLGGGLWINNIDDEENSSKSVAGAQSLRSIWLRPGSSPAWNGPHYIAPGAYIEFGYVPTQLRDANGNLVNGSYGAIPGFKVVRDDRPFTDPSNNIAPREMDFTYFIYKPVGQRPVLKLDNEFFRSYLRTAQGLTEQQIDSFLPAFNGVIFAEGNARVRGLLASNLTIPIRRAAGDPDALTDNTVRAVCDPPAVTVAAGANIYIEGSLLREASVPEGVPGSAISLLAQENVVVNPTMFMSPNAPAYVPDPGNLDAPFKQVITTSAGDTTNPFSLTFTFGDNPAGYTVGGGAVPENLLVRQAAEGGNAFLNLFINQPLSTDCGGNSVSALFHFNNNVAPYTPANLPPIDYGINAALLASGFPATESVAYPILPKINGANYVLYPSSPCLRYELPNQIRPALDPNFFGQAGTADYLFYRGAVSPMDVRIEAVMYAENGSFFVIPGYPLNQNKSDTRDAALRNAADHGLPAGTMLRPVGTADYFPFYGEPYDCRITVLGAIAENKTASIADQSAWMQLWGYIPEQYGSTGHMPGGGAALQIPDQHRLVAEVGAPLPASDPRTLDEKNAGITRGIRFIYDPLLEAPFTGYDPRNLGVLVTGSTAKWFHYAGGAVRQDDFGRTLPPLPRMPVCPGFVFYGEAR